MTNNNPTPLTPGGEATQTVEQTNRVRNNRTGKVGVVVTRHSVYPFRGDVTVKTEGGAALWTEGTYEEMA